VIKSIAFTSALRTLAIAILVVATAHAQDFKATFYQVYFNSGEGPENPKFIYTDTTAILDLVAKKKATLSVLGERVFTERVKSVDLMRNLVIPELKNQTLQGLKWGANLDIEQVRELKSQGPMPSSRWEVKFLMTASLFPRPVEMLPLGEGSVAVRESDVVRFTTVTGKSVDPVSRMAPIQFVLPVSTGSVVFMRLEIIE
jgi:hypothetical protein